jgi:hypothetical protein
MTLRSAYLIDATIFLYICNISANKFFDINLALIVLHSLLSAFSGL